MRPQKALVTVTSDDYILATQVWLYSILRHHRRFRHDVIVIVDTLSETAKESLRRLYPVRFVHRDAFMAKKVAALRAAVPGLRGDLHLRLLSLELFRLEGYERVVFLDSDGLCVGDLDELFTLECQGLHAVDDGFAYEDRADALMRAAGLACIGQAPRYGRSGLRGTFNAGAMVVPSCYLADRVYREIAALIEDLALWRGTEQSGFTDQMVLNLFFQGQREALHGRYNLMPFIEAYQRHVDGLSFSDARFIHFAGRIKPWFAYDQAAVLELAPHYLKYLQIWREVWEEMVLGADAGARAAALRAQCAWTESGNDARLQALAMPLTPAWGADR